MKDIDYSRIETIELDFTTLCNALCPLCYRNSVNFPDKYKTCFYRDKDEIIKQIDMFSSLKNFYAIGQLSEPTTHPLLLDILKHVKTKNIIVRMCTNGSLHDDEYWKLLGLILSYDDVVEFTICGSTNEIHSAYRRNIDLDLVLQHAKCLRSVKAIDKLRILKFRYNKDDISSSLMDAIAKSFTNSEIINTCYTDNKNYYNDNFDEQMFLPPDNIIKEYDKIKQLSDIIWKNKSDNIFCQSVFESTLQIDPYGKIYPCYRFLEYNNSNDLDYSLIYRKKYNCCLFCQKEILDYCNKNKLNDII